MSRALALARHALVLEIAVWRCLGRWVARRPDAPEGAVQIGYGQLVAPMLWLWSDDHWSSVAAFSAGSVAGAPFEGGKPGAADAGNCTVLDNAVYC